jgi:LPXTG-motif cell wall-anchored protein
VFPRAIAVAALAVTATLSLPAMATADEYPPSETAAVAVAGCNAQFVAEPGYFEPGEVVTFVITGVNDESITVTPAVLQAKTFPGYTAEADGSLEVDIMSGARTSGQYALTTTGTESPTRGPIVFSPTAACNPTAESALPRTGASLSPIWLGGGMLLAGALALGAVYLVRRKRV